jgi:hypothetical protein
MSAVYRYHQHLYRHGTGSQFRDLASRTSRKDALRLVFFDTLPDSKPQYALWLARTNTAYRVVSRSTYVVNPSKSDDPGERDTYVVLELVSRVSDRRAGRLVDSSNNVIR